MYRNGPLQKKKPPLYREQDQLINFYTAAGQIAGLHNKSYQLQFAQPTGQAGFMGGGKPS
jgi:hypothetical protein